MRSKFPMNQQGFPPHTPRRAASGNIFPLHKRPEIRPMPVVPIFYHRFPCEFLLEIGTARIGSISCLPFQWLWHLKIEPMHVGSIYQRIFTCHGVSKIKPLRNGPISSLKNAANFRRIHMSLPRRASNGQPHDVKRPPGACHPSVSVARSLPHTAANPMKKLRDYHIIDRARDFLSCWKHLASGADISGWKMATLEEHLDTATKARETVRAAEARLSALRLERRNAERELARLLVSLGYAVQGDPAHGGDSPFYTALGYVPASKRHPGRPRKKRLP